MTAAGVHGHARRRRWTACTAGRMLVMVGRMPFGRASACRMWRYAPWRGTIGRMLLVGRRRRGMMGGLWMGAWRRYVVSVVGLLVRVTVLRRRYTVMRTRWCHASTHQAAIAMVRRCTRNRAVRRMIAWSAGIGSSSTDRHRRGRYWAVCRTAGHVCLTSTSSVIHDNILVRSVVCSRRRDVTRWVHGRRIVLQVFLNTV